MLVDMGFELNPYDLCVANCTIEVNSTPLCGMWTTTWSQILTQKWYQQLLKILKKVRENDSNKGEMTWIPSNKMDFNDD